MGDNLNRIEEIEKRGMNFGLSRTRALLDALGSPDDKLGIIHVAGTNGKGSTCAYITSVLAAAGEKVGTFTSPAVFSYEEKFAINGKPCDRALIDKYLSAAFAVGEKMKDKPTAFEYETAAAFALFAGEGCKYAVIECGMGGRDDATNAINKKLVAVITSISLEHTAYLGNTIAEICAHKAGIIKDCPVVVNAYQCGAAREYFNSVGITVPDGNIKTDFSLEKLMDKGYIQPYNAETAVRVAKILGVSDGAIREGIKYTEIFGRLEKIKAGGREYVLDGAHNPAAFLPLNEYLQRYSGQGVTVVFGCLADKDIDGNLEALTGLAGEFIAVECPSNRALPLGKIIEHGKKYFDKVIAAESVTAALESARGNTVVVCGSFTLLKEAKEWIEKRL